MKLIERALIGFGCIMAVFVLWLMGGAVGFWAQPCSVNGAQAKCAVVRPVLAPTFRYGGRGWR